MLTVLTIEKREGKTIFSRFFNRVRGDSVNVNIYENRNFTMREIVCIQRGKNINLRKISAAAGSGRNCIVCSKGIFRDGEQGMYRFASTRFSQRICVNFALEVLRCMSEKSENISIGILDDSFTCGDSLRGILKSFNNVTVVSSALEEYACIADEILEESGASFLLTDKYEVLNSCNLIIAPEKIEIPLNLGIKCVVLTTSPARGYIGGRVYYKYDLQLPPEYDKLRPDWCSSEYFGSALYSKVRQYRLGSLTPRLCADSITAHTAQSLAELIV